MMQCQAQRACGPLMLVPNVAFISLVLPNTGPVVPRFDVESNIMIDPVTGNRFVVVTRIDETAPPGTAPVLEVYNYPAMTAYTGNPVPLVPDEDVESDPVQGCAGGVPFTQWVAKKDARPTGTVYFTNTLTGAPVATAPVGWLPGPCAVGGVGVVGSVAQIAGPARSATPAFASASASWSTSSVSGALQSVTVSAISVTDGMPGATLNQIIVDAPDGTRSVVFNGQTKTFSVARNQDSDLKQAYVFTATGTAYANFNLTFA